jgi:hypothetical protein
MFGARCLSGVHLLDNAGDAFFDDGNGFIPGLEGLGGVAGVEGARVGLLGGGSSLGLLEAPLKICESLLEVCFAHRTRLPSLRQRESLRVVGVELL